MDAQNVVGSDKPKPPVSPSRRPAGEPDEPTKTAVKTSEKARVTSPAPRDAKPSGRRASHAAAGNNNNDDDASTTAAGEGNNSDAETIVLPGKDGHSPSKVRKVKHEDKSDGEVNRKSRDGASSEKPAGATDPTEATDTSTLKKKRNHDKQPSDTKHHQRQQQQQSQRHKDNSSGLSSAPTSPPPQARRSAERVTDSESEVARRKASAKDRLSRSSLEKLVSHKRKASKAESDDEGDSRKVRRQRTSVPHLDNATNSSRPSKEHKSSGSRHTETNGPLRSRSMSPPPRAHRRSGSTQLPTQSSNGLSHKKKRVPAPLQTDYHSDDSSGSGGSPRPRSARHRNLHTPHTTESTISPAKIAPHKKHLDAHGQTFLARAVAKGDYEVAKQRLQERPEDLNVADYAGNTPLQIASINGQEDIVKLLLDAGCNLDCVNYEKDTPLLDAVDNGHLGVIKLLLAAGVNPRKANVNGEEPLDRVNEDKENAAEIRAALENAKKRMGERRQTSEDQTHQDQFDARSSRGPDSPRRSPAAASHSERLGRRSATVRATKTSNHLLYMPLDDRTLRIAAGRGDEATVTRILQVKDGFDDPEAMTAAARGGHDVVLQLLLALGGANPDPKPVDGMVTGMNTPMLAAIGQENIKVIDLLLNQSRFDPTRRFKGETYYDIARRRQGPNWKEEEAKLKAAFEEYRKSHQKDLTKTQSPKGRADRTERGDGDREAKKSNRLDPKDESSSRAHKRSYSSPSREGEPRKKSTSAKVTTSPKKKRRSDSFNGQEEQISPKRGPGRPRKEDTARAISVSDKESSPAPSQKQVMKTKRTESDLAGGSSEGESLKPRRKLISKGELRGERQKQRRSSLVSNSSLKDPSSPQDSRTEDAADKPKGEPLSEKYHDRTKALKRDESKDRLPGSGDQSVKRHRSSATPPTQGPADKDDGEAPAKKRRLDPDGKERRAKQVSSPERHAKSAKRSKDVDHDDDIQKPSKSKGDVDTSRREPGKSLASEKSNTRVKKEDADVDMPDAPDPRSNEEAEGRNKKARAEEEKKEAELEEARRKEEEQKKAREAEEKKRREEEEAKQRQQAEEAERAKKEEAERRRKEEEERKEKERLELEEKKRQEDAERKLREEEERKRREEEERKVREAREEAERQRCIEEERIREEEERKRREEEERKQREEEDRLRKEQLEREAAEEARRKREEEERRERERKERERREEMERKRAAREAEIRREQEERRLSKLPPLLRWLDCCPNPKIASIAEKFKHMQGVRYDTINTQATGKSDGREQWILNTQVALLLGETDLSLSRYTGWERIPVNMIAKKTIWRLESDRYALTTESLYDLGMQLPDYYGKGQDPNLMRYPTIESLRGEAWEKFAALDLFFVKVSDLMYTVPTIPHLRNLRLAVEYRELPEDETQALGLKAPQKWKLDPDADRFHGFAPRNKYYVNGVMVEEQMPGSSATSMTPFPEKRVPRRGLMAVTPDDPDYIRLCREQGLEYLVNRSQSPALPNGIHSSPTTHTNGQAVLTPQSMGTNSGMDTLPLGNGDAVHQMTTTTLPNGINGTADNAAVN